MARAHGMPRGGSQSSGPMKTNNDHRRAVALGWHAARERGEDQATYCSRQVPPIRPRTLRAWVARFAPRPGAATDIKLVYAALTNLQLLADALEAARLSAGPPPVATPAATFNVPTYRPDGPVDADTCRSADPQPAEERRRGWNFFDDL